MGRRILTQLFEPIGVGGMTHYKNEWFIKGATRLAQGKRFILDARLLPQFLCYCIKSEFIGPAFSVRVTTHNGKSVVVP